MISPLVFLFGLIVGSFLTVCSYRIPSGIDLELPEEGELDPNDPLNNLEVAKPPPPGLGINNPPRSFCPKCQAQLLWWHNIPFFSWVLLRGRCHFCKQPIPWRYPLTELITGCLALLSYLNWGLTPTAALVFAVCCALIVISVIDYDFYIIPDCISIPGTVAGLVIGLTNQFTHWFTAPVVRDVWESLWGLALGGGFLYLVAKLYLLARKMEGLGFGDVKLLAMVGTIFGPLCAVYTIFLGSLAGSLFGLVLIAINGRKMSQALPFGPYLACGTLLYLFGQPLLEPSNLDLFHGLRVLFQG